MRGHFWAFFCLWFALTTPWAAAAKSPPDPWASFGPADDVSYALWTVDRSSARVRIILPEASARRFAFSSNPGEGVVSSISEGLSVSVDGQGCSPLDQGEGAGLVYPMALVPGLKRYEVIFRCPRDGALAIHDHMIFPGAPNHQVYALITKAGEPGFVRIFDRRQPDVTVLSGHKPPETSAAGALFARAVWAAFTPPGLCIAAELLLMALRWRDLVFLVLGVGLGLCAASLIALSDSGSAPAPPARIAACGLIILLAASALLQRATAPTAKDAGGWIATVLLMMTILASGGLVAVLRPAAALEVFGLAIFGAAALAAITAGLASSWSAFGFAALFGLLNGLQAAEDLHPLHLTTTSLAPLLAAYDGGAVAAVLIVLSMGAALFWILSRQWARARAVLEDLVGAGAFGLGVFWFVSLVFS